MLGHLRKLKIHCDLPPTYIDMDNFFKYEKTTICVKLGKVLLLILRVIFSRMWKHQLHKHIQNDRLKSSNITFHNGT